jgi:hypothetical protein
VDDVKKADTRVSCGRSEFWRLAASVRPRSTACGWHRSIAERPHKALAMKTPAELYSASPTPYRGLPELTYPLHDRDVLVTACGRICMHRKRVSISHVLAGQRLGIKEVDEGIWIVTHVSGSDRKDWRRGRDSNPRRAINPRTLSRRVT